VVHSTLSNNKAYYDAVNNLITATKSPAEARAVLADIAQKLLAGKFP